MVGLLRTTKTDRHVLWSSLEAKMLSKGLSSGAGPGLPWDGQGALGEYAKMELPSPVPSERPEIWGPVGSQWALEANFWPLLFWNPLILSTPMSLFHGRFPECLSQLEKDRFTAFS